MPLSGIMANIGDLVHHIGPSFAHTPKEHGINMHCLLLHEHPFFAEKIEQRLAFSPSTANEANQTEDNQPFRPKNREKYKDKTETHEC